MFGLIGDLLDGTARLVGTVAGIAIAPVAIALGVSERMVRKAVVKCKWYKGSNKKDILNFESEPSKEETIKNCPVEWFDDAEYFEYVPVVNLTENDFKSILRAR